MDVYLPWYFDKNYHWDRDFTLRGSTDRHYKAIYDGPNDVVLRAYPTTGTHCSLQISGSTIEKLGQDLIFRLLDIFHSKYSEEKDCDEPKYHRQCTRIDIAFDNVPFTPAMCRDARLDGNIRTRSHPNSYDWRSNANGDTFYMGKRISGRLIRVYNMRGPVRLELELELELELKKKFALPLVRNLMNQGFPILRSAAIGTVRDLVDFVDLESNTKKSRAILLDWWEHFVGNVERIRFSQLFREDLAGMEEMRMQHFIHRMKPTLFMFGEVLGHDLNKAARTLQGRCKSS